MIFIKKVSIFSTNCHCSWWVGKMKALLAAKRSPVRWGSQMCLNVRWVSFFFVFMQQKYLCHSVVCFVFFTMNGNVFGLCVRAGFEAQNCQPALHLNRSKKLQVCTSPRLTQNPCYKPFFYLHVLESPSPNSKYRLFAFITIKFCLVLVIAV